MTLGWLPDCWGGQELSVEYSQSSVAALGAKLERHRSQKRTDEEEESSLLSPKPV